MNTYGAFILSEPGTDQGIAVRKFKYTRSLPLSRVHFSNLVKKEETDWWPGSAAEWQSTCLAYALPKVQFPAPKLINE